MPWQAVRVAVLDEEPLVMDLEEVSPTVNFHYENRWEWKEPMATYTYYTSSSLWGTSTTSTTSNYYTTADSAWANWNRPTYHYQDGPSLRTPDTWDTWVRWIQQMGISRDQAADGLAQVARAMDVTQQSFQEASRRLRQQDRELRQAEERRRLERIEVQKRAAEAKKKAHELLVSHLNKDQKQEFERTKTFTVRGSKGGVYTIRCGSGQAGNVRGTPGTARRGGGQVELRSDRSYSFCIHPSGGVPNEDAFLAQKLLLEHDEDQFLAIANAS